MLFAIGTKVRLVRTGDQGVVERLLDNGMVSVYLASIDMSIPVFPEDLRRVAEVDANNKAPAHFVPGKQPPKPPLRPERPPAYNQYTILKPKGIQLAFDPVAGKNDMPEKYRIFLINDTQHTVIFTFRLFLRGREAWHTRGRLEKVSFLEAGDLWYQELNESAEIDLEAWRVLPDNQGTGPRLHRRLKLKPAQFFNRVLTAPLINRPVHLYRAIENLDPTPTAKGDQEDLRTYTQRNITTEDDRWFNLRPLVHEVEELANFKPEIDLHIEKLVDDPRKIPAGQILSIQLRRFEDYIATAIRLGVERVFIIHGKGEGRLRNEIARRLMDMDEVVDFNNDYHPKYGHGATEVIF